MKMRMILAEQRDITEDNQVIVVINHERTPARTKAIKRIVTAQMAMPLVTIQELERGIITADIISAQKERTEIAQMMMKTIFQEGSLKREIDMISRRPKNSTRADLTSLGARETRRGRNMSRG